MKFQGKDLADLISSHALALTLTSQTSCYHPPLAKGTSLWLLFGQVDAVAGACNGW